MKTAQTDLERRLPYIFHLGLVELRNLAHAGNPQQLYDLADALEILPRRLDHWQDEDIDLVRFVLGDYREKCPQGSFDYLAYLDEEDLPETF